MSALKHVDDTVPVGPAGAAPWRLDQLGFNKLVPERVKDDDTLFFLLVISSFIETASDLYTRNLSAYYVGDAEVVDWLQGQWEHEEVQHGRALRAYVRRVWPEFDWQRAYAGFFADYSGMCNASELEPTRALEMVARCVAETGTSSLYRAIHDYTDEPLLKELTGHIKNDEVRHFKHFYRHFWRYGGLKGLGRPRVVRTIVRRIMEATGEDGEVAFRHAYVERFSGRTCGEAEFRLYKQQVRRIMDRHFPFDTAIKMLLKPLALPIPLRAPLTRALAFGARRLVFA